MIRRAIVLAFLCIGISCVGAFAQKPELVVQTGHKSGIYSESIEHLAFSPDSKMLATSCMFGDEYIILWHVETGKQLSSLGSDRRGWGGYSSMKWNQHNILHAQSSIFPLSRSANLSKINVYPSFAFDGKTRIAKSNNSGFTTRKIGFVRQSSFTADGSLLVVQSDSTSDGKDSVKIIETSTGSVRAMLAQSGKTFAYFSPNGKIIVTKELSKEAISIWDATTLQRTHIITSSSGTIEALEFSNDGKIIACCINTTIKLWDIAEGKFLPIVMNGHRQNVRECVFSPDGTKLYSTSNDSTIKMWDTKTGAEIKTFGTFAETTASIAVSPDGSTLALTTIPARNSIYLLDAESGKITNVLGGKLNKIAHNFTFTSMGSELAFSIGSPENKSSTNSYIWNFTSIANPVAFVKKKLSVGAYGGTFFVTTTNGSLLKCEYVDSLLVIINTSTDAVLRSISLPKGQRFQEVAISNDASTIVAVIRKLLQRPQPRDTSVIFNPNTFEIVLRAFDMNLPRDRWSDSSFEKNVRAIFPLDFSPDNSMINLVFPITTRTTDVIEKGKIIDAATGKRLLETVNKIPSFTKSNEVTFGSESRDTVINPRTGVKSLFSFIPSQGMKILNLERGFVLAQSQSGDTVGFHQQSQALIANRIARSPRIFTISPDGKFAIGSGKLGYVTIFDALTGNERADLYNFDSTNWAVTTPDGRFDGSEGGLKYLHYVVGTEPIELEQLKERYYEPGLLSKLMGFNKEPLREIERFEAVKLYPRVTVQPAKAESKADPKTSPKTKTKNIKASSRGAERTDAAPSSSTLTFSITLHNQGGGIGRVPVWLNGKELTGDARPKGAQTAAPEITFSLSLEGNRLLLPGTANTLTVRAFNGENAVLSRSTTIDFQAPGERLQGAPHLYAVIAGTSDYQGEELDLPFASNDAEQIAKAVQIASERLLGADKVHITLLTAKHDSAQSKTRTTKSNLVNALKAVQQKATANDILFVYLTGHGINWGGQDGDWYYLTCDARLGNEEKFADAALRTSLTLSSHEITDLMRLIPARKQTLALDACASGKAVENLLAARDVPTSQLRAMMRMKDRAGLHVISGCASNAVSYEASRYGQGLLTYSLLMGMKGAALRDNQFVDVKQLFEFAADRVPELARDIGRVQKPQVCSPFGGESFDIGLITASEAAAIPLADAKPLFVRANFQDDKKMFDQLNLGKIVNESLRGVTYRAATNPFEAWLVYLDVPEFPNSYSLNGRYAIKGDEITVSAVLRRGEEEGTIFTVKGTSPNVKELAQTLISETQKRIK